MNVTKHALPATWRAAQQRRRRTKARARSPQISSVKPPSSAPPRARLNYLSHYAEICGAFVGRLPESGRNLPKIERRCCGEAMLNNPRNEESSLYANASQDQLHDHFGTGEGVNFGSAVRPPPLSLSSIGRSRRCQVYLCISLQKCPPPSLPSSSLHHFSYDIIQRWQNGESERVSEHRATVKGALPSPSHKYRNTHSHSLRLPNSYRHL